MRLQAIALDDDGSTKADGTSPPSPPTPLGGGGSSQGKPSAASPALPAAVAISLAILIAIFTWRCIVLFRRPRRAAVLAKLGFVQRPRMFDVRAVPALRVSEERTVFATLMPLSAAPISTEMETQFLSSMRSIGQFTGTRSHRIVPRSLRVYTMDEEYQMVEQYARGRSALPAGAVQVAFLIAMPVQGGRTARRGVPDIADELGGVHIGTMVVVCPKS